ncbi:hypothetical protein [Hyphomicrobium sp.]|uniref:hypothetical protein n=1 Tax=Hyphomicrobium sp. TaxID=82 RepID=UPI002C2780EF|nr:hypothetical protein [Hyphomicrobium sp.]HRN87590.1 hypothetical protein [Hyphomicrobium sp.]HRQ26895.1 hypothetical protein [Hyphomicrobium sp.]
MRPPITLRAILTLRPPVALSAILTLRAPFALRTTVKQKATVTPGPHVTGRALVTRRMGLAGPRWPSSTRRLPAAKRLLVGAAALRLALGRAMTE